MTAGYDINLNIALKNSQKLMKLRKELVAVGKSQVYFNKQAKEGNEIAVATFNKLNKQLSRAKGLLNKAAYGTDSFKRAAQALVNVEKEHNHQLKERDRLLKNLRLNTRSPEQQAIRNRIIGRRAANFAATGTASSFPKSEGFLAFNNVAKKIEKGVKANVKQTTKTATILTQQATAANFGALTGQTQGFLPGGGFGMAGGQIGPRLPLRNRLGFGKNALAGPFAMQGGAAGRLRGGIGSAMIGGGFPFLFGAGGLSAAMGGIAGGIGGALAPGGGFAASIAATAIAAQIEDAMAFRKELRQLNAQIIAIGGNSEFSRKEIKQLGKELGITKEESIQAVEAFSRFEDKATREMLAKTLGTPEQLDALSNITNSSSLINEIVKSRDLIGQKKADELLTDLKLGKNLDVQVRLTKEIADVRRKQLLKTQAEELKISDKNFKKLVNEQGNLKRFLAQLDPKSKLGKIFKDIDPNTEFFSGLEKQLGFRTLGQNLQLFKKEFFGMLNKEELAKFDEAAEKTAKLVENGREYALQLEEFQEFKAPVDELERLMRPQRQILELSKAMKSSFEDSFKGLIRGTMSVADAFRNMFNRIADAYIDMVAKMFANQIQKGFLGMFAGLFNFGGDKFVGGSDYWDPKTGKGTAGPNYGLADGGTARSGKSYLVGERGPEIFTPKNTGTVIPNHELGGMGGGSTNISVNIDASGTSVEGSETNGEELGRLVAAAIQSELIKEKRPGGLLS